MYACWVVSFAMFLEVILACFHSKLEELRHNGLHHATDCKRNKQPKLFFLHAQGSAGSVLFPFP